MQIAFYHDSPSSKEYADCIRNEHLRERVKALVARANRKGLESIDPARNRLIRIGMEIDEADHVIRNCYGVFDLSWQGVHHDAWASAIESELADIRKQLEAANQTRLRFLIWVGMGGSAEDKHTYNAAGLLKRGPRCYVLDSTDPAKLKYILEDMQRRSRRNLADTLKSTLVVAMTNGMTSYEPVVNLQKLAALYDRHAVDPRPSFLYMTVPGSLLDDFAGGRGYRKVDLQPDGRCSTTARHSSPLTRGSLYPLGLSGVNLHTWMKATQLTEDEIEAAWELAAFLHAQGIAGRDKITLMLPKEWVGAALWTKQNFEESLGKSERIGIKVIVDERIRFTNYRSPKDPAQDRVFLAIQVKGLIGPDTRKIALLRRTGYSLAVASFPRQTPLSRYMQFIHYTVFGLAWLRDMNFVTQPAVESYEAMAKGIYDLRRRAGADAPIPEVRWRDAVTLRYGYMDSYPVTPGKPAPEIYASLLSKMAGDRRVEYAELTFFGDTRYSPHGRAVRHTLNRAAELLFRSHLKMPVDVYEGPAMNHSYHEMIAGHGRCFSTILISENPETIPEIGYTADYHRSQFQATLMALALRGRPVVTIAVKNLQEVSLQALDEFFRQAAKHVNL